MMNVNVWFHNLVYKIVIKCFTIGAKLNYFYKIIKYRGKENIPVKEFLLDFEKGRMKGVKVSIDGYKLCEMLKLNYHTSYLGKLQKSAITGNFKNKEDIDNLDKLSTIDNHRLFMYELLIKNNDVQKNRVKFIMSVEEYEDFLNWIDMKDKSL